MQDRFETFTVLIDKLKRCIRKIKNEAVAELDLKSPHVSCLYYLYINDTPLSAKEIEALCEEDKASVSRSVEYLEKNGYVVGGEKNKKRYKTPLTLTEKGRLAAKAIVDKKERVLSRSNEGLTEEELEIMYKGLSVVCENLQSICDGYDE